MGTPVFSSDKQDNNQIAKQETDKNKNKKIKDEDKNKKHKNRYDNKGTQSGLKHSLSEPDFRLVKKLEEISKLSSNDGTKYSRLSELPTIYLHNVKDFLKADIPLTSNSYPLCPHKHDCTQNAVFKGFFRTFAAAYVFKTTISLVTQLFGGKIKSMSNIRNIYYNIDNIKFSQFLGLMSFTYKSLLCLLRRLRGKDPIYHKTICGFISGLWIIIDDPSRRKTMALYCLVRSIGDWIKLINSKKQLPNIPFNLSGEVIIFTGAQLLIMYGAMVVPYTVDKKYYKWIKNMGNFNENTLKNIFRRLPNESFIQCKGTWHPNNSCLYDNIIDMFKCIIRAGRMYLPVHFLPMLLFTPKIVFNNPIKFIKLKLINTLRSSIFLSMYLFNLKETVCIIRNILKSDPWWLAIFGGFMSGLSLLIEHKKRRSELCLYVIPRALEILFNLIPNGKLFLFKIIYKFLRWYYLPVLSFACAISAWMTLIAQKNGIGIKNSNRLNMTVLKIVFGSKH